MGMSQITILLLHGRPVAQSNGKIRHFHISHNAPYPPPPPPQKKKNWINFCFSFLLGITTVPKETENNTYANCFFGRGAGGEQIRCILGNVEVLKARRPWGRGWRVCWFSVEKRQNGGWITQNELRGHIHWFFLTNTRKDWARFSRLG